MYIPVGRRTALRAVGHVADFCPFCRGFRPFLILRSEMAYRLYTFAVGPGVTVGHLRRCETCSLETGADPANYRQVVPDPAVDLETLIALTNPEIGRNYAARLMLEDRIRARKLSLGERATLLREPFAMAEDVLTRRNEEGRLDLPTHLGCLGSVILPVSALMLLPLLWKAPDETIETVVAVVGGLAVVFTFLAILTDARRHARRAVLPRLVDAIRPLDPAPEEVDEIIQSLKADKSPLPEVIGSREINNALLERWE